ncbi:MAG: hypothetical protein AAFX99_14305 [Myxococcota bacterium]
MYQSVKRVTANPGRATTGLWWVWLGVATSCMAVGCIDGPGANAGCEDGEVLSGERCIALVPSSSDGSGGGGGATDTGSNGVADSGMPDSDMVVVTLPFAVDDYYGPSGYMGDGEVPGGLGEEACAVRPDGAVGACHQFTWNPGELGWAGVYWQYPEGNWGDAPGLFIPAGATQVAFKAWGAQGGEQAMFVVGIEGPDGFVVETMLLTLTTEPTEYAISLRAINYTTVVGGFGWFSGESEETVVFSVDDIRWE